MTILSVAGGIAQQGLAVAPSALFGHGPSQDGDNLGVVADSANFAPSSAALSRSEQAVANGLQAVWNAGGNPASGAFFAGLDNVAGGNPAAYAQDLNRLSPRSSIGLAARVPDETRDFTDSLMSCPQFADGAALVTDGRCSWMQYDGELGAAGVSNAGLSTVARRF